MLINNKIFIFNNNYKNFNLDKDLIITLFLKNE